MSEIGTTILAVDHKTVHELIDGCVTEASAKQELFTILFVQLRGIRRINTVLGYDAGEKAVISAMQRVREFLPECDTVGRISSDEFVVVSKDCNSPSCAIKGSRATIEELQKNFHIAETECVVNPVVGIALYPEDGGCAADLVRHSALAAERACVAEGPHYAFFSAGLGINAHKEFDLQQSIRKAISQQQLELYY